MLLLKVVLDDESRKLKQKHRDELKEYEANKNREIERLKEDFNNIETNLKERLNQNESNRHLLEDVLNLLFSDLKLLINFFKSILR